MEHRPRRRGVKLSHMPVLVLISGNEKCRRICFLVWSLYPIDDLVKGGGVLWRAMGDYV